MDDDIPMQIWNSAIRVSEGTLHPSSASSLPFGVNAIIPPNRSQSLTPVQGTSAIDTASHNSEKCGILLLDLPMELISYIFEFLSYEQLSIYRAVCKTFDTIGQSKLNAAFNRLNLELESAMLAVKHMLPKRESKRRYHPLARINEIYSVLETRFALLNMTFKRYIEDGACCFMAGKILDEAFCVLHYLNDCMKKKQQPEDAQDLLKDIRDYSSMAIEYFDDHIASTLQTGDPLSFYCRTRSCFSSVTLPTRFPFAAVSVASSPDTPSTSRAAFNPLPIMEFAKMNEWRKNWEERLKVQEKTIAEQGRVIKEQSDAINHMIKCLQKVSPELSATYLKSLISSNNPESSESGLSNRSGLKRKCSEVDENSAKKERII